MIRTLYFLFVLFGCSVNEQNTIEVVQSERVVELQKEGVIIVDIRTPEEYSKGHIPGVKHINFFESDFLEQMKGLGLDNPMIIHCASGGRSGKASKLLKEQGFKKVYDYSGGFSDWNSKGLKVER
ncbi:Rhodanese-related sulfurtransferase [Ekhidna lutea]|uniref:Rhodanese-related sulfurtransferase n=1 Tax=Ekhidna lutea TaxID=447679 RepID=A0A239GKK5_EKHLU|nr:rhodanese-like domain-containing protein [Ekhidna lutea]SNS69826.1 Rhodanese-related sulfurtransferase [Ekhidna lutea]